MTDVNFLYDLQENKDIPLVVDLLPDDQQIIEVDLNTRTIAVPQFLSVQFDHNSEVVYFKTPRYFEGVDLATTTCIIQYVNADGDTGIYCVPFYDLTHFEYDDSNMATPMILLPWALGGLATISAGTIRFNIRFYIINGSTKEFDFNLSTKVTEALILQGMNLSPDMVEQLKLDSNVTEQIYESMRVMMNAAATYWSDFDEEGKLHIRQRDISKMLIEPITSNEIDN